MNVFIKCIFMLSVVLLFGCAYQPPLHETRWTHSNVQKIIRGMTPNDVVQIFGLPDKQSVNTYGAITANPWQGLHYEYIFHEYGRYCNNSFTFAMQDTTWLNSWDVNCIY